MRPNRKTSHLASCLFLLLAAGASAQGVDTYIDQLVKPGAGDDSKARLEIRRLTNLTFRPGAEAERKPQEASLLAGLSNKQDWEVKSYLLDELRYEGKTTAIVPVAAYLGDANLCEPSAMALLSIGSTEGADKVVPAFRAALGSSTGKCRVTMMRALGSLRDADAATVDILIKEAAGTDRTSAYIALRGLANIGDIKARVLLADALKSTNAFERSQAVSLNLLFAQRLAERGLKLEGTDIANAVKAAGVAANLKNVVSNAESTLVVIGRTVVLAPVPAKAGMAAPFALSSVGGKLKVRVFAPGAFTLHVVDTRGKVIRELRGEGAGWYDLGGGRYQSGIFRVAWTGTALSGGTITMSRILFRP